MKRAKVRLRVRVKKLYEIKRAKVRARVRKRIKVGSRKIASEASNFETREGKLVNAQSMSVLTICQNNMGPCSF